MKQYAVLGWGKKVFGKKNMPTTVQHGNGTQTPCSVPKLHAVASDNVTRPKKKSFLADGGCYKVATEIIGQPENWKGILLKPGKHLILVKLRSTSRTALEVSQIFPSFAMILPWFVPYFAMEIFHVPCCKRRPADWRPWRQAAPPPSKITSDLQICLDGRDALQTN